MDFVITIALILLFMVMIPFILGNLLTRYLNDGKHSVSISLLAGFLMMISVFEVLCVPMTFAKAPFTVLSITWLTVILILCFISIIVNNKILFDTIKNLINRITRLPMVAYITIGLIAIQVYVLLFYMHIDDDDALYVGIATTARYTNTILEFDPYTGEQLLQSLNRYALSLLPVFYAAVSFFVNIHAAIFMHSVIPAFLIPLAYIVYYNIAALFFAKNKTAIWTFLMFVCIANIFGYVSVYTASTFFLFRIWQGKAVLASILLPLAFLFFMRAIRYKSNFTSWMLVFLTMTAAGTVSSMGIFLAPMLLMLLAILFSFVRKKIRIILYALLCCAPNICLALIYLSLSGAGATL